MKINIFDIDNGKVIINENCLLIPELAAVVEAYENPIPALSYLYYRYDLSSPYANLVELEKEEAILEDYPGEYTTEDDVIIAAGAKLESLCMSPTKRYYLDNKVLLEKLGAFGRDTEVFAGRDGNYTAMLAQIKSVGKTIEEFRQLEKTVEQEIEEESSRARGDARLSYDFDDD